jgi:hypothetical protein
MNSRPLLDYLTEAALSAPESMGPEARPMDTLEARLRELEARLGAHKTEPQENADLTLSAQIEAILKRRASMDAPQPVAYRPAESMPAKRAMLEAPPMQAFTQADAQARDADFLKFTEAVYLIGQAAKRFIGDPAATSEFHRPEPAVRPDGDVDALAAVLRETVSAFRSVADDLAVSAGEIRNYATRAQAHREDYRRSRRPSREDDEIGELRDTVADLQARLDGLLGTRRRARY